MGKCLDFSLVATFIIFIDFLVLEFGSKWIALRAEIFSCLKILSKFNKLMCKLLNPVTSTITRRKEMHKDVCGNSFILAEDSLMFRMKTKINAGLL